MEASIIIRSFIPSDAMPLIAVYRDAIAQARDGAYEVEEQEALLRYPEDIHSFRDLLMHGLTLVAVIDEEPVAFGQLYPKDRIAMLYRSSAVAGQGIASSLYWILEAHAVFQQVHSLKVEASRNSLPFLARLGFQQLDSERVIRHGVEVERFHLMKEL